MGLYSIFWIRGFYFIEDLFDRIKYSPVLVTGFGGFLVGIIELWFPEVDGSIGYGPINDSFALKGAVQFFVILALAKFLATAVSIGSGGSGGVFAPSLMQGALLGAAFGVLLEPVLFAGISPNIFAVLGMAALFAASTRAALTTIIMTSEMIGDFNLFIPLLFTVTSAWLVSGTLLYEDIYIYKLIRRGYTFEPARDVLEELEVRDIMTVNVVFVTPSQSIMHVLELMEQTGHTGFPVLSEGRLVGIITEHDVDKAIAEGKRDATVGEICTKDVFTVQQSCPVSLAVRQMASKGINRMPVVESIEEPDKVIGWISRSDILRAYTKAKKFMNVKALEDELFGELIIPDEQVEPTRTEST